MRNTYWVGLSLSADLHQHLILDFESIAYGTHPTNLQIGREVIAQETRLHERKFYTSIADAQKDYSTQVLLAINCDSDLIEARKPFWDYDPSHFQLKDQNTKILSEDVVHCIPRKWADIVRICHSRNLNELHRVMIEAFRTYYSTCMTEAVPKHTPFQIGYIIPHLAEKIYPGEWAIGNMFYNGERHPGGSTPRKAKEGYETTPEAVHITLIQILEDLDEYRMKIANHFRYHSVENKQEHIDFYRKIETFQRVCVHAFNKLVNQLPEKEIFANLLLDVSDVAPSSKAFEEIVLNSTEILQPEEREEGAALPDYHLVPPERELPNYIAKGEIQEHQVDLNQFPQSHGVSLTATDCLVLGDLHGNSLKLINFLLRENVITGISEQDYEDLKEILNIKWRQEFSGTQPFSVVFKRLQRQYEKFIAIIAKIKPANAENPQIILVGDNVAERVMNDLFTLEIMYQLNRIKIFPHILHSNHDREFFTVYEKNGFDHFNYFTTSGIYRGDMSPSPNSLNALGVMLQVGLVSAARVKFLIEKIYLPLLTGIIFNLNEDNPKHFIFISHAPVGLRKIDDLNKQFGIEYPDDLRKTPFVRKAQVEAINKVIAGFVQSKTLIDNSPDDSALYDLMWKRVYWGESEYDKDELEDDWDGEYIHGHDGCGSSGKIHAPNKRSIDLDNRWGKELRYFQGAYTAYYFGKNPQFLKEREAAIDKMNRKVEEKDSLTLTISTSQSSMFAHTHREEAAYPDDMMLKFSQ